MRGRVTGFSAFVNEHFSPDNIWCSVYVCDGEQERGAYTATGKDYLEVARRFGKHWNDAGMVDKYGTEWKDIGHTEGNPKKSMYVIDERGNKLLLIEQN